ncbi:MAG: TMEM175 family protein, partial [Thermoanaerobaculia bacterium]
WRSHEITRIEGFSDAVFGFAITLLIVSLEVPRTSTELLATMRGFGAFVVTFGMLASLWFAQYTFFRRYGLEDRVTVILNLVLLFTVLFFVFPLKFLFGAMLGDPTMRHAKVMTPHGLEPAILPEHRSVIFLIFGLGFAAVFTVFLLLYRHAWKHREALGLNEFEEFETRYVIRRVRLAIMIGGSYVLLAALQLLPDVTRSQRLVSAAGNLVVLGVFIAFMVLMVKMTRERRARKREWLSRAQESPDGAE